MSHLHELMTHLGLRVPPTKGSHQYLQAVGLSLGGFHTQFQPDNYTDQMRVYKVSALVYRCAQLWAESILQAPVRIFRVRDQKAIQEITRGHVWEVLTEINGHVSFREWVYKLVLDLALTGNHYTWKVRNQQGRVVELWPFRPDEIQIAFDPHFDPRGKLRYEWRPFAGGISGYGGLFTFRRANILHLRLPSSISQVYGTSPLRASAEDVIADQKAKRSTLGWLDNEGVPAGVLQTESVLDEDEAEHIKQRWRDAHSGPTRSGRVAVLGSGTSFTPITVMPKDLEWMNQRKMSRAGILAAYGVPPIYAGVEGENFANRKEQRLLFWQDTIRPKLRLLEGQLTEFLLRDFDPELVWQFDESQIDAFVEALAGRVAAAVRAANPQTRVMRPFEARARLLGMQQRFEGDDRFIIPGNMVTDEVVLQGETIQALEGEIVDDVKEPVAVLPESPEDAAKIKKLERFGAKERAISENFARDLGRYFRSLSDVFDENIKGKKPDDLLPANEIDRVIPAGPDIEDALLALSEPHLRAAFQEGFSEGVQDIVEEVDAQTEAPTV